MSKQPSEVQVLAEMIVTQGEAEKLNKLVYCPLCQQSSIHTQQRTILHVGTGGTTSIMLWTCEIHPIPEGRATYTPGDDDA